MYRAFIVFLLVTAAVASADTIRLKNGRSIVADSAREKDDKVEYEIGDNTYRIPKSLVERIESSSDASSSGLAPQSSASPHSVPAPTLAVPTDPSVHGVSDFRARVIHDGKVDSDYLNSLESNKDPRVPAAGYFIAGRFEYDHGNFESAWRYFEHALYSEPDNGVILTHYAAVLVQLGRAREAISYAEQATHAAPDSADPWAVLGYAYFNSDRSKDAVPAWQRSLEIKPDPELQRMLERTQRELSVEANFTERDTGKFTLRYEGNTTNPDLRRQIVETLEKDYDELSSDLGILPKQNIPVVLYTEQAFFDVTQAPTWTSALNDGKLRIPIRGITSITPDLARVLKHELAHSFINQASSSRCPQWLNEGIAQLAEGRSLGWHGAQLAALYKGETELPLKSLEKSFMKLSRSEALLAYDESLAATMYIHDTFGKDDLRRLLEHLAQGGSLEEAMTQVLHLDYADFERELSGYLQSKYGS